MRYIVTKHSKSGYDEYLTPRRATGKMYESRVSWSAFIDDAKVFNTKGAATNSAKKSGVDEFEVKPVALQLWEGS